MNINLLVINFQILLSEFSVFSILRQYNEIYLVKTFVLFVLIIPFSITLCFFFIEKNLKKISNNFLTLILCFKNFRLYSLTILFIILISVFFSYIKYDDNISSIEESKEDLFKKNYIKTNISQYKKFKNTILIVLEGYDEDLFSNKSIFNENLLVDFKKLNLKNFYKSNLPNLTSTPLTQISLQSQIAILCGVYLNFTNKINKKKFILKNQECLQDIFNKFNYHTEMATNTPLFFHNSHKFYLGHKFDKYNDPKIINNEFKINYNGFFKTINDASLFDYSYKRLKVINDSNKPFFFYINTLDTHSPGTYYDNQNCDKNYNSYNKFNNIKLSVKCTNRSLLSFLNKVSKLNSVDNIIIVSDHNYSPFSNINSKLFNLIFSREELIINKKINYHHFDFYPLILKISGFEVGSRAGLGILPLSKKYNDQISINTDYRKILQKYNQETYEKLW